MTEEASVRTMLQGVFELLADIFMLFFRTQVILILTASMMRLLEKEQLVRNLTTLGFLAFRLSAPRNSCMCEDV